MARTQRKIAILMFLVCSVSVITLLKRSDYYATIEEVDHVRNVETSDELAMIANRQSQHKKVSNTDVRNSLPNLSSEEITPLQNTQDNTTSTKCNWLTQQSPKPPFYLTAVLLVRIYESDKANLTSREMLQWLEYLRYAGVEHVYVYDAWVHHEESQEPVLSTLINKGFVTYIDWHEHNPYTIASTQVAAYQHCIDQYSNETTWQTAIDIDEYPFAPNDTKPGFFHRFVQHIEKSQVFKDVTEVSMENFLYLGKPLKRLFLIDRVRRRVPQPANILVKPVYKPKHVRAQVHHNTLKKGRAMNASPKELRMNHYWGARLQDWGEDTPKILEMTIPDYSIKPIVTALKECKQFFIS